jgi:hypothetical protein
VTAQARGLTFPDNFTAVDLAVGSSEAPNRQIDITYYDLRLPDTEGVWIDQFGRPPFPGPRRNASRGFMTYMKTGVGSLYACHVGRAERQGFAKNVDSAEQQFSRRKLLPSEWSPFCLDASLYMSMQEGNLSCWTHSAEGVLLKHSAK